MDQSRTKLAVGPYSWGAVLEHGWAWPATATGKTESQVNPMQSEPMNSSLPPGPPQAALLGNHTNHSKSHPLVRREEAAWLAEGKAQCTREKRAGQRQAAHTELLWAAALSASFQGVKANFQAAGPEEKPSLHQALALERGIKGSLGLWGTGRPSIFAMQSFAFPASLRPFCS